MSCCVVFLLIAADAFAQNAPLPPNVRIPPQNTPSPLWYLQKKVPFPPDFLPNDVSPLTQLQATVKGTFWRNPIWIKLLDLSPDQQKKMDGVFQQYRLKLFELTASLQKEELTLEPMFGLERPTPETEGKIFAQIDRIADARAELEKTNSRMLVGILQVLTPEQWSKLPVPQKKLWFKQAK